MFLLDFILSDWINFNHILKFLPATPQALSLYLGFVYQDNIFTFFPITNMSFFTVSFQAGPFLANF